MEHSNQHFSYDHDESREQDSRDEPRRASYSHGRTQVASRRRSRKRVANAPACGFNGRRSRRWTW